MSSGASSSAGRPRSARRWRSRSSSGDAGTAPRVSARQLGRGDAGVDERAADLVGAGHDRLAQELGAELAELGDGLAVEGGDEAGLGGDAGVDRVGGEVVLEDHLGRGDARDRGDRVVGVGDHQEGEVRGAEVGGQAQPDHAPGPRRTPCRTRRTPGW